MTPADKQSFIDKLQAYGTDFSKWPESDVKDIERYMADPDIKEIFERERETDSALDLLKAHETPHAFTMDSLALTAQKSVKIHRTPAFRMALAASLVVALLILTPVFLDPPPQEPIQEPIPVDQFLNEVAAMTDPEEIDPNIFFEQTAQAPSEEDIDQFLNDVLDTPADPIEEKDIWEIFTNEENARG